MGNFFEAFEAFFVKFWNSLYEYLCEIMGVEVNEDWFITELYIDKD